MANIINYLNFSEQILLKYFYLGQNYINALSYQQTIILTLITALLVLILAWYLFGSSAAIGLLLLLAIIYILYHFNIFGFYQSQTAEESNHLKSIQDEIEK
jgi:heme/copper-type cytochrome/quinol oxidase subunit 4